MPPSVAPQSKGPSSPSPRPLAQSHVLISGGTSGIGFEAAKALCLTGAHVYITGRQADKGSSAVQAIKQEAPSADVTYLQCDVSSLRAVEEFAERWRALGVPLHALSLNAGTFLTEDQRTEDGFEVTLASNFLGHFFLLHLLLPDLLAAAPARVVWTASAYEQLGWPDFYDVGGERAARSGLGEYCTANLYCIMAARELQRRLPPASGVDVFTVQPGLVNSALWEKVDLSKPMGLLNWVAGRVLGQSPRRGAISNLHCLTAEALAGRGGGHYGPPYLGLAALNVLNASRWPPLSPWAHRPQARSRLYDEAVRLIERKTGEPLPNKLAPPA